MPEGLNKGQKIESLGNLEEVNLSPEASARIQELALQLPLGVYTNSFQQRGDFVNACEAITRELTSSNVGESLKRLKEGKTTVLRITGLPRDPSLPPAPLDGSAPLDKKTFVSEGFACGVALSLGYPSLILAEKKEALVHQITPVPGKEDTQSNEGSVDLKLHQDLSPNPEMPSMRYDSFMPDWLILTGVQTGSGHTPTFIASVDSALGKIKSDTIDILSQGRFITNPPYSFGQLPDSDKLPVHPVLIVNDDGKYESAFDISSELRPRDPNDKEADEALFEFHKALNASRTEIFIEPGTAVVFNNRRVVHGRGPVVKETENTGTKRWIQRVYIFDIKKAMKKVVTASNMLKVQAGGGLFRVTSLFSPDLPEEFDRLMGNK